MRIDFDKLKDGVMRVFWVVVLIVTFTMTVFLFLVIFGVLFDLAGVTNFNIIEIDRRTYQEKQMDAYELFEIECLSREYSKDECLVIWSKDNG